MNIWIIFSIFAFTTWVNAAPIPLGNLANIPLEDEIADDGAGGWTDQGAENSLTGFPTGTVRFEGVEFSIPEKGKNAAIAFQNPYRAGFPSNASIAANGMQGNYLYLLSSCAFDFTRGQEVASITIRYADGTSQQEALIFERHTGAWWTPSTPDAGVVAWRGKNGLGVPIGVYLSWIKLTSPGVPVVSIDVQGGNNKGYFILLGLSLSDAPNVEIQIAPQWLPAPFAKDSWIPTAPVFDNGHPSVWEAFLSTPAFAKRSLIVEANLPLRNFSPEEATRLARFVHLLGYNTVRLPSLETLLPPQGSSITTGVDPQALSSLHYVLQACAKEHLAVSLTLGGGREYGIDDGVAAYRQVRNTLANQCLIDPEATRLLLDSMRAAADTQPVSVSLLSVSMLLGDYTALFTPPHLTMLQNSWVAWLTKKYTTQDALLAAWQIPQQPAPLYPRESLARKKINFLNVHNFTAYQERFRQRFADQIEFLESLQVGWFAKVIPEVRKVFPDTSIYCPSFMVTEKLGDFQIRLSTMLDGIEVSIGDPALSNGSKDQLFSYNTSPFLAPTVWTYRPAFNRIAGKPFVLEETASAWPNEYGFTRLLLTMVFGGVQGWEGILHREILTLPSANPNLQESLQSKGLNNPAFLGILPLGRHLFLRGDLQPAPLVFSRMAESPASFREHGTAILPLSLEKLLFVGGVGLTLDNTPMPPIASLDAQEAKDTTLVKSVTGEVECDLVADQLKITTSNSVALAGKSGGEIINGQACLLFPEGYGVVYATSLAPEPLCATRSILLGAVGRTRNTDQIVEVSDGPIGFFTRLWRILQPGKAPILMAPVRGVFSLDGVGEGNWKLQALNLLGQPLPIPPTPVMVKNGKLQVEFTNQSASLFLLSHE